VNADRQKLKQKRGKIAKITEEIVISQNTSLTVLGQLAAITIANWDT